MKYNCTNEILEDHGDWLLVDISTNKFPNAKMAVDADVFKAHKDGRIYAYSPKTSSYIYGMYCLKNQRKTKLFHRSIIDCDGSEVDHIKHGTMEFVDNRRSNLRTVTKSQNSMNGRKRSSNTSGIVGVSFDKRDRQWYAYIHVNGKMKNLGYFDNIDIAIGVRQQAEKEYYGDYAYNSSN